MPRLVHFPAPRPEGYRLVTHRLLHNVTPSHKPLPLFALILPPLAQNTTLPSIHKHTSAILISSRDTESHIPLLFTNTAFKGRLRQKAEFMSIENLKTFGKLGRHLPLLVTSPAYP